MAILDFRHLLSDEQSETTQDTHPTENDIDLGESNVGYDAYIRFIINDELTSSGSSTVKFAAEGYDGSSWVVLAETRAIDYDADIVAEGKEINVPLPRFSEGLMEGIERVRGSVTIGSASLDDGTWSAYLVSDSA